MNRPPAWHSSSRSRPCALAAAGCGEDGQEVDSRGAELFAERCARLPHARGGGHRGQQPRGAGRRARTSNNRRETKDQVLYAIRNGGFSGAIMPQNIVVGEDAEAVAEFVAEYAGKSTRRSPPGLTPDGGANESGSRRSRQLRQK